MKPFLSFGSLSLLALALGAGCSASDEGAATGGGDGTDEIGAGKCMSTPNRAGWCWATKNHPPLAARSFAAVADDDVWAAATRGLVLHFDGAEWKDVRLPTEDDSIGAVWASAKDDVWGVGRTGDSAAVFRYDGARWREVYRRRGTLESIWGTSNGDVWFGGSEPIGQNGLLYQHVLAVHWDGKAFVEHRFTDKDVDTGYPGFTAIHGSGADDVWAVGDACGTYHFDGKAWTRVKGVGTRFHSVYAAAPDDVWLGGEGIGASGALVHFDGTSAAAITPEGTAKLNAKVRGIVPTSEGLLVGVATTTFAVADSEAELYLWDGKALRQAPLPTPEEGARHKVSTMGATPSGKALLSLGRGDYYRGTPTTWERTTTGHQVDLTSILSNGIRVIVAGRSEATFTIEDGAWQRTPIENAKLAPIQLAGSVYAPLASAGKSLFERAADGSWQKMGGFPWGNDFSGDLRGGAVDRVVTRVGDSFWERDKDGWKEHRFTAMPTLRTVFVPPGTDFLASDGYQTFRLFDGDWIPFWTRSARALTRAADGSYWGIDERQTVGVPGAPYMLHDDTPVALPDDVNVSAGNITSMTACPDGRLYALAPASGAYFVIAYDGGRWHKEDVAAGGLSVVHCDRGNRVWALGEGGVIVTKPKP